MSDHGKGGSYVISPAGEKVLMHRTGQAVAELPATVAAEVHQGPRKKQSRPLSVAQVPQANTNMR